MAATPAPIRTGCCIAGGGPAGMMLGFLLARGGVDVLVLEKHADFLRDFRGDTIHPSTLEVVYELGLLEEFLKRPHQELARLKGKIGDQELTIADFSHLPTRCKFIAFMPQWDFLNFLADQGRRYASFHLRMEAEVTDVVGSDGRVTGVIARTPNGTLRVDAGLIIGADGRASRVRQAAGLEIRDLGAPIDVLWMEISKGPGDPAQTFGRIAGGRILVLIDRGDYWQCAYVIAKGAVEAIRERGLPALRESIATLAPFLRPRVGELRDWDDLKLLTVKVDRLRQWYRPGLLCIGDAAHAMSPIGGVGINLAIQDAVAAANILALPLKKGAVDETQLRAVQQRRELPTRVTQRVQLFLQDRVIRRVLTDSTPSSRLPLPLRLLRRWPMLQRIPAYLVGIGVRPEHVRRTLSIVMLTVLCTGRVAAQRPCDGASEVGPSRDLYCIELVPAPGLSGISGRLELGHAGGPFTVAVTRDGRPSFELTLMVTGLPSPRRLGRYASYVAWIAPPTMNSVVSHGAIRNGRNQLGSVSLEKFTFLITAERDPRGHQPHGRVVLRGQSPATRLFPPDLLQFSIGSMPRSEGSGSDSHDHGATPGQDAASSDTIRWTTVPMPPGITMLPAEMALRPALSGWLPTAAGPPARARELVHLETGDTLRLEAGAVRQVIGARTYTLFAFNGQLPGPLIEVARGSEVTVLFNNHLPQPTSIHWHGIRLDNPNDGTPGMTQPAIPPGAEFTYRLRFPDAGIYWYHPHVREDLQQELGLYGNILVRPERGSGFGPVNREAVLMLDDLLVSDAGMVPLGRDSPTHALMGRFGNVFLVNGETSYRLRVKRGEVVRFFLTNAASARTLNLSFPGARMKVVASDVGAYQREQWVESVVIAPAERYVVHVRFDRPGRVQLVNLVRGLDHLYGRFFSETDTLGVVDVAEQPIRPDLGRSFAVLRNSPAAQELERYRRAAKKAAHKTLLLTLETRDLPPITQRLMQLDSIYFPPVEWSGTMPMMNWASTGKQVRWVLRDPASGRENMDLDWRFHRGEPVRIRLVNDRSSVHAMQHPIHFHGQRFLVLAVNGEPTRSLVWKDTVLVPAGGTVDILLDPSNPGRWMAHCHIAEHLSAGMMMGFTVE